MKIIKLDAVNRQLLSFVFFTALVVGASSGFALDAQLFRPHPDRDAGVSVLDTHVLKPDQWQLGFFINWDKNPIEFGYANNNQRIDDVANWYLSGNLLFSYGLNERITFDLDLPLHFADDIEALAGYTDERGFSIGDVLIRASILLSNPKENGWRVAVSPFMTFPTGEAGDFLGEDNFTGGFDLIVDRRLTPKDYLGFNFGFRGREKEEILNLKVNHEIIGRIGYVRKLWVDQNLDAFAEIYSSTTTRKFLHEEVSSPAEFRAGLKKHWPKKNLVAVLGFGRGMNNGYGAPDFRVFGGLSVLFGKSEEPVVAPSLGAFQILVRDEDGKDVPASVRVLAAESDNVLKAGEDQSEFQGELSPGEYRYVVRAEGYVEEKGSMDIQADERSLIEVVLRKAFSQPKIELVGKVLFDLNEATIKQESLPVLDNVVSIMKKYPEIKKVRVEAHTDSQGSETYNLNLSKRRAKSVMDYLIGQGIEKDRLTSQGFGETNPISPNDTKEGRAINRRVEFVILENDLDEKTIQKDETQNLHNLEN